MFGLIFRLLIVGAVLWFVGMPLLKLLRRVSGRTLEGRVWLAREGIVEESTAAVVLFPWNKVNSFDKTELHGKAAIRIWLNEDPDMQFRLLNIHLPSAEHKNWVSGRVAALERSKYWTSAQLVLRQANVDESMEAFFKRLKRLAENPRAQDKLPSILDDPAPLDLSALGIGTAPTTEESDVEDKGDQSDPEDNKG